MAWCRCTSTYGEAWWWICASRPTYLVPAALHVLAVARVGEITGHVVPRRTIVPLDRAVLAAKVGVVVGFLGRTRVPIRVRRRTAVLPDKLAFFFLVVVGDPAGIVPF